MSEIALHISEKSKRDMTVQVQRWDDGVVVRLSGPDDWAQITLTTEQADSLAKFLIDHGIAERARAAEEASA